MGLAEDKLSEWLCRWFALFQDFVNVKNGASTSLRVGRAEELLWGIDPAWHEGSGLLVGACGCAGRVLDGYRVQLQLSLSSTMRL